MTAAGERVPVRPPARMAYVTSAFPTATETFVLFEILEVERLGGHVDVYPLRARGEEGVHPEADRLRERTHYMSLVARETLAAQVHWLRTDPRRYLRTMASAVVRNVRSPRYLLRALYVAPLAARMAR
ncbi:MAG: colanic acid biosynthesis glycosyltransferase WcaL, partial [Thermoleophilia bacterium]|nr:colanic acid biosynthesis glycosyltransferase WcaL [Thermoleophilia bacterium]